MMSFFFSSNGIVHNRERASHTGGPTEWEELGYSSRTRPQLIDALSAFFAPNTYDTVYKNCNAFSDCALFYLLGSRLPPRYCTLERLGKTAGKELLHSFLPDEYKPNKSATDFSVEDVIRQLEKIKLADLQAVETAGTVSPHTCPPQFALGMHVTIVGLTTAFNGMRAKVVCYNGVNNLWKVKLLNGPGEVKAFRAENLQLITRCVPVTKDVDDARRDAALLGAREVASSSVAKDSRRDGLMGMHESFREEITDFRRDTLLRAHDTRREDIDDSRREALGSMGAICEDIDYSRREVMQCMQQDGTKEDLGEPRDNVTSGTVEEYNTRSFIRTV